MQNKLGNNANGLKFTVFQGYKFHWKSKISVHLKMVYDRELLKARD